MRIAAARLTLVMIARSDLVVDRGAAEAVIR